MKKITSFILAVSLMFSLGGCSFLRSLGYVNSEEETERMAQAIISALDENDVDALRELFSQEVVSEADDLDKGLAYLFEVYQGSLQDYTLTLTQGESAYGGPRGRIKYQHAYITITTSQGECRLFFELQIVHETRPESVGLTFLKIVKSYNELTPEEKQTVRGSSAGYGGRLGAYCPEWDIEQDQMDGVEQRIVAALDSKDRNALSVLFSQNVLAENDDIEEGLDYIFEEYQGSLTRSRMPSIQIIRQDGKETIYGRGTVSTDEHTGYGLIFEYRLSDPSDPSSVGLMYIKLDKRSHFIQEDEYMYHDSAYYGRQGIYHPGWDTQE